MWIHLLTTRLIDGAGSKVSPSSSVGGGYSYKSKRKRNFVEIDGTIYEGDYATVKTALAAIAKKRAVRAAKKSAPKGATEAKKPEQLPQIKAVGFDLSAIRSLYVDEYFQSYANELTAFRRRQDEEEIELLIL